MFERTRSFFAAVTGAGSKLPVVPPPKVSKGQVSFPGYVKSVTPSSAALKKNDLSLANTDLVATYRLGTKTDQVIRDLTQVSPDLSTAVSSFLRVGIPEFYTAVAYNPDGSFNREATALALQLLARMDLLPDYTTGFAQIATIRSLSESLGKELIQGGACALEVVLDKSRLPSRFQPIPVSSIEFYEDAKGLRPMQVLSGTRIDLDQPTFIYTSLDQSLLSAYASSPIESAIQPVLASMTFLNDLRRVCARHVYPRYDITIDEEKLRTRVTPDVAADPEKLAAFLNGIVASVETVINGLGVEEALVHFDFLSVSYIEGGSNDVPSTFSTVKEIYDSKVATGAKALPSILGHSSASQNVASTETMLFMMTANGMVRLKLQEVLSKALTLSVRLFGLDVTVKFQFDSIDLRPASELEAFKAMKQSRVLDQLSLGFITDDEACLALTGQLTPVGYEPKTGTMFRAQSSGSGGNPYSGTSTGDGGGALNQNLKPKAPQAPKGPVQK